MRRLLHWRLGVNLVLCLNPGLTFTVPWLSWRSWGWLLGKHKIDRWISEKLFCFVLLWRSGNQKNQRSSPPFHELWGLSADQEPVALTLAEAIYGTLVACGKFIWSRTWRQSLSTLEAALVWTLSTFDGWMYLKKDRFFDLLRWRRNNRTAECLWDDSSLSFVDVFQTEYFSCA